MSANKANKEKKIEEEGQAMTSEYDELAEPPCIEATREHKLWPQILHALKQIHDPEIPVNIYELGLIYKVEVDKKNDVSVKMSLTSPGCPVAQDMPGWVQSAIFEVDEVNHVDVEVIWDPPWDPSMMAETAKLELNMFT
jgi:FeS assembly SUF system protein